MPAQAIKRSVRTSLEATRPASAADNDERGCSVTATQSKRMAGGTHELIVEWKHTRMCTSEAAATQLNRDDQTAGPPCSSSLRQLQAAVLNSQPTPGYCCKSSHHWQAHKCCKANVCFNPLQFRIPLSACAGLPPPPAPQHDSDACAATRKPPSPAQKAKAQAPDAQTPGGRSQAAQRLRAARAAPAPASPKEPVVKATHESQAYSRIKIAAVSTMNSAGASTAARASGDGGISSRGVLQNRNYCGQQDGQRWRQHCGKGLSWRNKQSLNLRKRSVLHRGQQPLRCVALHCLRRLTAARNAQHSHVIQLTLPCQPLAPACGV